MRVREQRRGGGRRRSGPREQNKPSMTRRGVLTAILPQALLYPVPPDVCVQGGVSVWSAGSEGNGGERGRGEAEGGGEGEGKKAGTSPTAGEHYTGHCVQITLHYKFHSQVQVNISTDPVRVLKDTKVQLRVVC